MRTYAAGRSTRRLAVVTAVMMIAALAGPAVAADWDTLTDELAQLGTDSATVGFALALVDGGECVYAAGFGERTLGSGAEVRADSIFHWASVSKPLVATAIMQLSERGRLDLDARLVDVLPGYRVTDPRQSQITVRQLLLHTSGLPDVEDYEWDRPQYDERALGEWALRESPRDLVFDPGTDRAYSNVGFEVLGAVIEKVTDVAFETWMSTEIFRPLGMSDTTFLYPDTDRARRTTGHAGTAADKHVIANYPYNRRHAPSSTLNSTVLDMARFARAMLAGGSLDGTRVLAAATVNDMWAPRFDIDAAQEHAAAMGWVRVRQNGHLMLRHFGGDDGFRSALVLFPDSNQAIVIVSNDEEVPMAAIALTALRAIGIDLAADE